MPAPHGIKPRDDIPATRTIVNKRTREKKETEHHSSSCYARQPQNYVHLSPRPGRQSYQCDTPLHAFAKRVQCCISTE